MYHYIPRQCVLCINEGLVTLLSSLPIALVDQSALSQIVLRFPNPLDSMRPERRKQMPPFC